MPGYRDDLKLALRTFSWEGIEFPGRDCTTTFGHDSAQHRGYGLRGADVETTGPKAKTVRVTAVFLNGLRGWTGPDVLFPNTYQRFVESLEANPNGLLGHPTRGTFRAHFDEGTEEIRAPEKRGLTINLSFTEQGGEAELADLGWTVVGTAAENLLAAAAAADAAAPSGLLATLRSMLGTYDSLRAQAADVLRVVETAQDSYVTVVSAIDEYARDLKDLVDDPNAGALAALPFAQAINKTLASATRLRQDVGGARVWQYVVPAAASLAAIAADPEVYGDARRAPELAAANVILTPWRLPAGTVLTVVD